jgi:hypothetical protein
MAEYKYEYKQRLLALNQKHEDYEFECLMDMITQNIFNGKSSTKYSVTMKKGNCKIWNPYVACFNIINKLRLDGFRVQYQIPNRIIIYHKTHIKLHSDKKYKNIMKFLKKENVKTLRYQKRY